VLGLNYSNGSISSVDMDGVGVMAAYLTVVRVCTAQSRESTNYIFVRLLDNKVFLLPSV